MKITSSIALVGLSYTLRLGSGMAVLIVLARTLGTEDFGFFTYWLTISTLVTIPINFGFPTMILREFGATPKKAAKILSEVLSAKLFLTLATLVTLATGLFFIEAKSLLIFLFLLLAQIADSFAEFFNLGFRRSEEYKEETRTAIITSCIHLILVIGTTLIFKSAYISALAFFVSRLSSLTIVGLKTRPNFIDVSLAPFKVAWQRMKSTWAFALEVALNTGYNQADTLIINHLLDHASVGIYQSGMKLVEGACKISPVIAQVLIPKLASKSQDSKAFNTASLQAFVVFTLVGGAGGAVFFLGAPWIAHFLYGPNFSALTPLLPFFGLMLLCRYWETAGGLLLVAAGLQHYKVWLVLVQFTFMLACGTYATFKFGLVGWQLTAIAALLLVTATYLHMLRSLRGKKFLPSESLTDYDRL